MPEQHLNPRITNNHLNTIALSMFFILLSLIGVFLMRWQYSRANDKEILLRALNHPVEFTVAEPAFIFVIEEADKKISLYFLGTYNEQPIAIAEDLVRKNSLHGYWHPLEQNIFQSDIVLQKGESLCKAYNLWACHKNSNINITGILKDYNWKPSVSPERHRAYALQWAGLSFVCLLMSISVNNRLVLRLTNVFFDTSRTTR